jgi:hypothetical protein
MLEPAFLSKRMSFAILRRELHGHDQVALAGPLALCVFVCMALRHLAASTEQHKSVPQQVFRWTSVGRDRDTGSAIGIQHTYPSSQIGLASNSSTLRIARDMVNQMQRWNDANRTVSTIYFAAARVG